MVRTTAKWSEPGLIFAISFRFINGRIQTPQCKVIQFRWPYDYVLTVDERSCQVSISHSQDTVLCSTRNTTGNNEVTVPHGQVFATMASATVLFVLGVNLFVNMPLAPQFSRAAGQSLLGDSR